MDIVFLGINNFGWEIYDWLCDREGATIHGLVTDKSQLSLIKRIEPDLVVAAGFQHIVPPEILQIPNHGCINVHPGYLPHTRGFNPNVWSIVEDLPAGVSIHYMNEEIDAGDIIARREVKSSFSDTGKSLYRRIESAAVELFTDIWPDIRDGEINPVKQTDAPTTYHRQNDFNDLCKIEPEEEYQAKDLINRIRALTFHPFNNAFLQIDGKKYYVDIDITPAEEAEDDPSFGNISSY